MKEHKIGEIVNCDNTTLQVEENKNCEGCYFYNEKEAECNNLDDFACETYLRSDKTGVIYKEIKNMQSRKVEVTFDKAKEWYTKGGELREVALQAYTEDELKNAEFPVSVYDCLDTLIYASTQVKIPVNRQQSVTALLSLILARDAWWKIDNNWKPDWESADDKYTIEVIGDNVVKFIRQMNNTILSFRTEEIRDKFYDAFKNFIEEAKELL